jgi:hypothetical protein
VPATDEGPTEHCSDCGPLGVPHRLLATDRVDMAGQRRLAPVEAVAADRGPDQEDHREDEGQPGEAGTRAAEQSGPGSRNT